MHAELMTIAADVEPFVREALAAINDLPQDHAALIEN
jgi:hypothetical protein